jgi:hypothetical protein
MAPETAPAATLAPETPARRRAGSVEAAQGRSAGRSLPWLPDWSDADRVLVTGWRHWPALFRFVVYRELQRMVEESPSGRIVVVDGNSPVGGVDDLACEWANAEEYARSERHPARRGKDGRLLGGERNTGMVRLGAWRCLAFPGPGSMGTVDCLKKAVDADIPTTVVAWSTASALRWAQQGKFTWDGAIPGFRGARWPVS